jgi:uncharacterized protein
MPTELTIRDLRDLATGAAFLGTGGGGDPYIGRLLVERAMADRGPAQLLSVEELDDEAFVIPTAIMGAPTVMVEKLPNGGEAAASLRRLEEETGRSATATMPIECGGINSMIPLLVGVTVGLPVVDGDGMGRAFPELQMETFNVYGVSGSPMAITAEHGDSAVLSARDNPTLEWMSRGLTIRLGGYSFIALYPMDGRTVKRVSVAGTMGLGVRIGRCIREARTAHEDPFDALVEMLADTPYQRARVVFRGKVTDVFRRTTEGFAKGHATLAALDGDSRMELQFQNEHLIAQLDGEVVGMVPDLICVLDSETADPVTTESLRYGQRVKVMVVSAPPIMRTPEALEVFGPRAFGFDRDFTPMEDLAVGVSAR